MFHRRTLIAGFASAALLLTSPAFSQTATTDNLEITGGFARETAPMARTGAAYMTIRSLGEADRLLSYTTPVANRPELHTHIAGENGVMQMRQVEAIEVPAGGVVELKPGGLHLMMIDLTQQLVAGDTVAITLMFEKAGEVAIEVPVKSIAEMGDMSEMNEVSDMGDMDHSDEMSEMGEMGEMGDMDGEGH